MEDIEANEPTDDDPLAYMGMIPAGPIVSYETTVQPFHAIVGSWGWTSPRKKHGSWLYWGLAMCQNLKEGEPLSGHFEDRFLLSFEDIGQLCGGN